MGDVMQKYENHGAAIAKVGGWMIPQNLNQAMELAKLIADCGLVPDHLQKKPGNCLLVLSQAARWGMDPFAVAQCTSVVHGRLCYEGKLVHAVLLSLGTIDKSSIEIDYFGTAGQDGYGIKLSATLSGGKTRTIEGTVGQWKTRGKKKDGTTYENTFWRTMPADMLLYRAWRQWARRYAPEALLGVTTPDEVQSEQYVDATIVEPSDRVDEFKSRAKAMGLWEFLAPQTEMSKLDGMSNEELSELFSTLQKRKKAANASPGEPVETPSAEDTQAQDDAEETDPNDI